MSGDQDVTPGRRGPSRRQLLFGGAVAGLGAAAAIGADSVITTERDGTEREGPLNGAAVVPFHGRHQAGIATPPRAHSVFLALDLHETTDRDALRRYLAVLSDDAARLTRGRAALADSEPELAQLPAGLSILFGFGPGLVARVPSASIPDWLAPLPPFGIDRLDPAYSDGDLLLQVAADDPLTVAHAVRMLLKDSRSFARLRWTQTGFRRAHGSERAGTTMRNLFGQIDGTTNPEAGSDDFDRLVWIREGWLAGGTGLVVRRIRMDLDKWDRLDRGGREHSVGRTLATGAPLTGELEHDEPDFAATTPIGLPVIAPSSHLRRARSEDRDERIVRRAYNYDDPPSGGAVSESGLIFASFQADITRQFVPIQRRLDALDLLNEWTTPIGSAVFAVPPGCEGGGYVGETLLG